MNAVRVVLDPRSEGGAVADLGGGVLFGMPTRYNKGPPLRFRRPAGREPRAADAGTQPRPLHGPHARE
jgi:hypothetical protein